MVAYYNEFDPQAAEWLRILILQGNIAPGVVDERSIEDVRPEELKQYTQCHFFAGIGGWSYALRLAGWADDRPCWTGSPPCQPFSNAGKQKAQADSRHLWPVFFNLIRECQPTNIFGEQVEAAIRTGWLDDLQDDLEAEGYAAGKIVLPACSVGGYHIRQRIWFVAERRVADSESNGDLRESKAKHGEIAGQEGNDLHKYIGASGLSCGLANANDERLQGRAGMPSADEFASGAGSLDGGVADTNGEQNNAADPRGLHAEPCSEGRNGRLADTASDRCQRQGQRWPTEEGREPQPGTDRQLSAGLERSGDNSTTDAPETIWRNPDWLYCRDGKWRPVESGTFPLAHGIPGRVGLLRGYGNAIVPQVAAQVIRAYMDG